MRFFVKARRAFTLVEIAIVLAISAIVIGAIWMGSQVAYDQYRIYKNAQNMMTVVRNIREHFEGQREIPSTLTNTQLMTRLCSNEVFPRDMRRSNSCVTVEIDHAFNSTTSGGSLTIERITGTVFRLRYQNVPRFACQAIPVRQNLALPELAVQRVALNATVFTAPNMIVNGKQAADACTQTDNTNSVSIDFKLYN
jgi:prepilin-type N-terminal cleavage/methylation domain-containing protein